MIRVMPCDEGRQFLPDYIKEQIMCEYGKLQVLSIALDGLMQDNHSNLRIGASRIIDDFGEVLENI